ncbi:MAG TPA: CehA/McbA family metallohydrolase [Terriglobales bacterium]|nr:CehA/McbA family metallohydrolase [Terriglobales bacterium]
MLKKLVFLLGACTVASLPTHAQRRPVLPQIDLPHPYYYRELYLPQLTSGPSSVTWGPDSKEVIYSMAGSLWRQKLDSKEAVQITDGPGYDYQPDWSPDGKSVIYVSYQKDAMELWLLDLPTGKTHQLTEGGAVNVEPRWSPDGKQIVFVSTSYHKRFHIFRADVVDGKLENVVRLTGETKSDLPRYYYSAYDTEINPVWTRDSQSILFVSNKGHIHGTGGFWLMKAEPGALAREIHYEETNWNARPDFSPDGSRMVYSSYLGREWHQLWVMPAKGGDAFPISYGDWDDTNVRWSPDAKTLAFISNRSGNTELWFQTFEGGGQRNVTIAERTYLKPNLNLVIDVTDENGKESPARISVTGEDGRFYAPENSWIFADDGYDRSERPFEAHYFYAKGRVNMALPLGKFHVEVVQGFERPLHSEMFTHVSGRNYFVVVRLAPKWPMGDDKGHWVSSDLHVHMDYGGTYRSNPAILAQMAKAEDVSIVNNLIVNKEQRFPDIAYNGKGIDPASDAETMIVHGQEFHTSYWGHRGILGPLNHILLPGYAGYPNTAAASLFPMNADVYDMAHEQGALVGAVHPFDEQPDPFANPPQSITDELPVDVALGKLDYMEIVGFSDHKSTAAIWYHLLNLGFHLPAGAGTDATTNYAAPIRGNVGFDRVYAWVPEWPLNLELWMDALKKGRTFATNGPLVEFTLDGHRVGDELNFDAPRSAVPFTAKLRSIVPVDHLEVVCNGRVARSLQLDSARESADVIGTLPLAESGWCVLRAYSDKAEYPVLDKYPYATTSPIYVNIAGHPLKSPEDAKYFDAWIGQTIEVTSRYPDWNSPGQKEGVLRRLREAQAIFRSKE